MRGLSPVFPTAADLSFSKLTKSMSDNITGQIIGDPVRDEVKCCEFINFSGEKYGKRFFWVRPL